MLDELNAEHGEQIAAMIAQAGTALRTHRIKTGGTSTITVMPKMFGGPHMPQARVCTSSAVCDRSRDLRLFPTALRTIGSCPHRLLPSSILRGEWAGLVYRWPNETSRQRFACSVASGT